MNSSSIRTLAGIKKSVLILSVAALFFGAADIVGQSTASPSSAIAQRKLPPWAQITGVDIFSDTQRVDFSPYISRTIKSVVKSWAALLPEETQPPVDLQGETTIRFTINPDGRISAMRLETGTKQVKLDRAAWGAITSIGQFSPLPPNFSGPNLELRIHFMVNEPPTTNP